MEQAGTNKQNNLTGQQSLFVFLLLEILFFLGLNIDYSGTIIRILGILLAIYGIYLFASQNKKINKSILLGSLLLLVLGLCVTFSPLYRSNVLAAISFSGAFAAFFILGYLFTWLHHNHPEYFIGSFLVGLLLLIVISLAVSFIRYGFFYRVIYAGKVIYYAGSPVYLDQEVTWLYGFTIQDISIDAVGWFLVAPLALVIPLFMLAWTKRKNKHQRWLFLLPLLMLLPIILLPLGKEFIYLLPAIGIIILLCFYQHFRHVVGIISWIILGLIIVAIISGILWAFNVSFIQNIIDAIPLLTRIFSHPYLLRYQETLQQMVIYPFGTLLAFSDGTYSTQNFLLDSLRQTGVMGFLSLLAVLIYAIYQLRLYWLKESNAAVKVGIIGLIVSLLTYAGINYPIAPLINNSYYSNIELFPFLTQAYWLVIVFLLGYVTGMNKKVWSKKEQL